jgi:lysophospholipase L1-like esterase
MFAFSDRRERRVEPASAGRFARSRIGSFGFPGPHPVRPSVHSGQPFDSGGTVATSVMLSTPDSTALSITGDLDIAINTAHAYFYAFTSIFSKWSFTTASQNSWILYRTTNATTYVFNWYDAGGSSRGVSFNVGSTFTVGTNYWFRVTLDVDNGAGGHAATLWYAPDSDELPTTWTQVATGNAGSFTTTVRATAASVVVWGEDSGYARWGYGGVFRDAVIRNGIAGTVVARCRARDIPDNRATSWQSRTTSETWTMSVRNGRPVADATATAVVACDGDSLTTGYAASVATASYPAVMASALAGRPSVLNLGRPGDTTTIASTQSYKATAAYRPDAPCVYVLWLGTNDMTTAGGAASGATVWAALRTRAAARRAEGWKVVLCTTIPRTDSGSTNHVTEYPKLNALMLAQGAEVADAVVDLTADPRLMTTTDGTYFNADRVHLTDAGYAVVAEMVAPVVNRFL